jgi:hypothetical protein
VATASQADLDPYADATTFVDEALDFVKSTPGVTMSEGPDDHVVFVIAPSGRRIAWQLPVACFGLGVAALVGYHFLTTYNPGLPEGYVWSGAPLLMILGLLNVVLAPVALVVQVVHGPPRAVTLDVSPGALKAERSIAGDRVVSHYAASEIEYLFVEHNALYADTRKGQQGLVSFGEREVNVALGVLLASRLWYPDGAVCFDDKQRGRRVFLAASRLRANAAQP